MQETAKSVNIPRSRIGRGLLRLYLALWAGLVFFCLVPFPLWVALHDHIPIGDVYDDFRGETILAMAIVLILVPALLLAVLYLAFRLASWVRAGFIGPSK